MFTLIYFKGTRCIEAKFASLTDAVLLAIERKEYKPRIWRGTHLVWPKFAA